MTSNSADLAREQAVSAKLARFLAHLRHQQGFAAAAVAERASMPVERLCAAEQGKITLRSMELRRLANALGVPEIILLAEMALLNRIHRPRESRTTDGNRQEALP